MLNTILNGEKTENTPLLIVHGLYGSGRNWGVIAKRMSDSRQVVSVDMRNHGHSPWHDSHSYHDMANDLTEVIESYGQPMDIMGHSMGGKAAMVLALTRPDLLRKLVVADIAPVGYAHTQAPLAQAMMSLDLTDLNTRGEADKRFSQVVDEPGVRAFLLQSLDLKSDPARWRLNLNVLEAEMDKIIGFPKVAGQFQGSTLFLSGADSDYVKIEYRPEIKTHFPAARFAKIPGAGHWLHADKPREFEAAMRVFLDA
ncbi:alpha/beta fold hydrolase [Cochlodiniinecator piscidefendens]|uniref:alpha/beta fold hydrolase n=1 Tax=Cochlodiniinecator piscidefendens TaxID=2715756 RepID=UPI00140D4BB6|nr:alpha/beta fold hydrolase [Cochlodiniinecator piscidefendens]